MELKDIDIIYFVKQSDTNEELRYSLRTVEKNFPHRYVWFIGGKPKGLEPDKWLHVDQNQSTKWANTSLLLRSACMCDEITDDFVMFNDDFYVLSPCINLPYYIDGTLLHRIDLLRKRWGKETTYCKNLINTYRLLKNSNCPYDNYAVHYPIIFNKHEMLETFEKFPTGLMWRSIYGNHHRKLTTQVLDCKITDNYKLPSSSAKFVSTQDSTFRDGVIGKLLRNKFNTPCKYEIDRQ